MSAGIRIRDVAFIIAEADGTISEANQRAEELLGSRRLEGLAVSAVLPGEDPGVEPGPSIARTVSGEEFPVLATAIRLGERCGYGIVDLRDPEGIRDAFAPTTSLPSRLIDELGVGVVVQVGGEIVSANAAAASTLGLTLDELLGRTSIDPRWHAVREDGSTFVGDEHPAMVALRTGEPNTAVMGVHTPSGELRWIDVAARPLISHGDHVVATFTHFIDITARRRADADRDAALVRYEALLGEASDAVLIIEPDGLITYAGPSSRQTLGRGTDHLVGTNVLGLAVVDDRPAFAHAIEQAASRPAAHVSLTIGIDMLAGVERWFEARVRNAVDLPEIGALVATLTDVHERVMAVERLRTVNEELERRLLERDEEHRVDRELAKATELLGHCDDDLEIQGVVWTAATAVFPDAPVTFLRARAGTNALEIVASSAPDGQPIDADDCWAMRTHRVHASVPPTGLTCHHVASEPEPTICVPLGLAIRPYGLLVVRADGPGHLAHATALAERLSPLLARRSEPTA